MPQDCATTTTVAVGNTPNFNYTISGWYLSNHDGSMRKWKSERIRFRKPFPGNPSVVLALTSFDVRPAPGSDPDLDWGVQAMDVDEDGFVVEV